MVRGVGVIIHWKLFIINVVQRYFLLEGYASRLSVVHNFFNHILMISLTRFILNVTQCFKCQSRTQNTNEIYLLYLWKRKNICDSFILMSFKTIRELALSLWKAVYDEYCSAMMWEWCHVPIHVDPFILILDPSYIILL